MSSARLLLLLFSLGEYQPTHIDIFSSRLFLEGKSSKNVREFFFLSSSLMFILNRIFIMYLIKKQVQNISNKNLQKMIYFNI